MILPQPPVPSLYNSLVDDTLQYLWISLFVVCLVRLAWQAMRQLHPEAIAAIQSKALFSQAEEALLAKIGSVCEIVSITWIYSFNIWTHQLFNTFVIKQTSQPKLDVFQELLSKHPGVFHPSRTPKSLLVHWQLLKQYYLLDDQSGEFNFPPFCTNIGTFTINVVWFFCANRQTFLWFTYICIYIITIIMYFRQT